MWQQILDALPNIELAATLVGLVAFIVTYAKNSDWRKTKPGRALMYLIMSMAGVLGMSFIHLLAGPYFGIEAVRIAVYGAMTFSVFNILSTLRKSIKVRPWRIPSARRKV